MILEDEKNNNKLDGVIIDMFATHYDEILEQTREISEPIIDKYENLQNEYNQYMNDYSELNHETDSIGAFSFMKCIHT